MWKPVLVFVPLFLCALAGLTGVAHANVISNPSFETPVVPIVLPYYQLFLTGSTSITSWTVVGPAGANVAVVNNAFTQSGYLFPAQDGVQWLDLTGASNLLEGVAQAVTTIPGTVYDLSFYVGNVSGNIFGATSTVDVRIDGTSIGSATNSVGGTTQNWQPFTFQLTASGISTVIEFYNLDPITDNHNGLDMVILEEAPAGVPEPAPFALIGCGAVALLVARRCRRSS